MRTETVEKEKLFICNKVGTEKCWHSVEDQRECIHAIPHPKYDDYYRDCGTECFSIEGTSKVECVPVESKPSIVDFRLKMALDTDHRLRLDEESFDGYEHSRRYLWGKLKAEQCPELEGKDFQPSDRLITVCCVCKAEKRSEDQWLTTAIHNALENEGTEQGAVWSHGYCPKCYIVAQRELDLQIKKIKTARGN